MRMMKPLAIATAAALSSQAFSQAMLEEVIVTATKRTESLQDVPVAVVAVSGDKIVEAGIQSLVDMADYVPNVYIGTSTGGSPAQIVIRGVGSGNNAGFEQSVGMFNDGVYQGRAYQYLVPFLDVASVEVMKGPQGTLFGKNTVAGAISVKSAQPTHELEGRLSAQYEMEYGSTEYTGYVSGGLTDNLAGRLAAKYRDNEGPVDNLERGKEEPALESSALRGSLLWTPADSVDVFTKLEYAENEGYGGFYQASDISGVFVSAFGAPVLHEDVLSPLETARIDDETTTDGISEETLDVDSLNGVVKVDWEIGGATFTSVTGYSDYDVTQVVDSDFSSVSLLENPVDESFEQISQEFRLVSAGGETLDYIVGLYLEQQDLTVDTYGDFLPANVGVPVPDLTTANEFAQDGETAAAFGQLTWRMSDSWSLTGGLRFAYEKKEATLNLYNADLGEREPTSNPFIDLVGFSLAGRVPGLLDEERSTENWSPTVNLQWEFSDEGMAYAKASRGFKSGGFNARAVDSTKPDLFEFDDEQVDGLEIGTKMSLLGGAATLNAALFYSEFTDRQVSTFLDTGFVVGNAAESTSKGLEIDGRLAVNQNLTLGLSLGYLKSEYDSFADAGCSPEQQVLVDPAPGCENGVQDLSGATTTRAPEWTAAFVSNFYYPMGDNLELRAALDVIYSDEFYLDQSLDSNLIQDSATKVNARLALASSADTWEVALIGKNLTDELTSGTGAGFPFFTGSYFKSVLEPRTVALEVSYNWF